MVNSIVVSYRSAGCNPTYWKFLGILANAQLGLHRLFYHMCV